MYFRIILFLGLVAGISLGIHWVVSNDGSVEFIWLGYNVQTSVAFFIFAITFVFILLLVIFQMLLAVIYLPKRVGKRYQDHLLEQSLKNLQTGYAALLSGDLDQAKKYSGKLAEITVKNKAIGRSLENLSGMLAAKVAQEQGDLALAEDHFNKFLDNKKSRFFAVKSMLDNSFQQGKIDEAISYAQEAYELKPNVKDGAHSLLELYKKAGKLDMAEEFLNKYKRRHRIFKDKYNDINIERELCAIWLAKANEIYENDNIRGAAEAGKYLEKVIKYDSDNKETIILLLKIYKRLKLESRARKLVEGVWYKLQSVEVGLAYLDVFSATNYKDATKKKLRALNALKVITPDSEILERLKDKIYDFQIEY